MRFRCLSLRDLLTVTSLAFASVAQAELPRLQPTQVLRPTLEDIQPDPEQPPGEATFGRDVVIKGDLAAVGLPSAHAGAGLAAVFERDANGIWIRRATLTPEDSEPVVDFGKAVALSGRRLLVASTRAVFVFDGGANTWRQRQKLAFDSTVSDVAFAGKLAVVGTSENGAQAFYWQADGTFHASAAIMPSDAQAGDRFGAHVAISGATVAITAPGYNNNQGAAYVFTCTRLACRQQQKLLASDGDFFDQFGDSVDVLGNTLAVGATNNDPVTGNDLEEPSETNFTAIGAAYVFVRNADGTWVETQKLRVTPQEYNWYYNLGSSVALTTNGIVVGAPYGLTRFEPGKMFVYRRMGGTYVATHEMIGPLGLGHSIAVSGGVVLGGAPQEGQFQLNEGEVDVYSIP
jgi:hypothetical protein